LQFQQFFKLFTTLNFDENNRAKVPKVLRPADLLWLFVTL